MALTKEQIKEFEEKEKEAKISDDLHEFQELADAIAEAGDKDWAKKIYKKAEEMSDDCSDIRCLADSICQKLGDKKWAKKVYEKAEEEAEAIYDHEDLAESVRDNLGDEKWAKLLEQKAKELEDDY